MNANDIAMILIVIGLVIGGIITMLSNYSDEIVKIIREIKRK